MAKFRLAMLKLVIVLSCCASGTSEEPVKYALRERTRVGQQWLVELQTRVEVQPKDNKARAVVMAEHRLWEHVLALAELSASPTASRPLPLGVRPGLPVQLARYYEKADWQRNWHGTVTVSHKTSDFDRRQLRPERRLLMVMRHQDETVVFSPNGPLTREELDLTQGHLDLLMVPNLLPENLVSVGNTWTVPIPAVQALCGLDGVTESNVQGKLVAVEKDRATIQVSGKVEGITDGSETVNTVTGTLEYDLTFERWTRLQWRQTQQRQAGPVTAAMTVMTDVRAERRFDGQCQHLTPAVLQTLPTELKAPFLLLAYRAPNHACEFLYDRNWHRVAQDDRIVVFRLLDRGEMIAQMNITFWPDAQPGQHLTPQQIREFAEKTPNFQLDKVIESGELSSRDGRWIYRHTVQGKSEDLPVLLTWYVIANQEGRQVIIVFTTEPTLADKLGGRDLAIVQSVTFLPRSSSP